MVKLNFPIQNYAVGETCLVNFDGTSQNAYIGYI